MNFLRSYLKTWLGVADLEKAHNTFLHAQVEINITVQDRLNKLETGALSETNKAILEQQKVKVSKFMEANPDFPKTKRKGKK